MRAALITGITGQDGSYLAELLLSKGYKVYGIIRRSSSFNTGRIDHIRDQLTLRYGDLGDEVSLRDMLQQIGRDFLAQAVLGDNDWIEVYNLGAMSHVQVSFEMPLYTADIDGTGTLRLLEACRTCDAASYIRFYQASTSEMFGAVLEVPQCETTPFNPRSPYAVAKVAAHGYVKLYREAYGMFACSGILFNHESPRRGDTFVTKKITNAVRAIAAGKQKDLTLGNLESLRDWGHARDYVEGMWLMLQQPTTGEVKARDYVLATGVMHSVREFVVGAFGRVGIDIEWRGNGLDEVGVERGTDRELVRVDARYIRPAEVEQLCGDSSRARAELGWAPKVSFDELIDEMLTAD